MVHSEQALKVLCGVVLFNPEQGSALGILETVSQCGLEAVIFDNSPDPGTRERNRLDYQGHAGKLRWLSEDGNVGLSRAFNRIVDLAERENFDAVVLFDQDSTVPRSSLERLIRRYAELRSVVPIGVISGMAMRDEATAYRTIPTPDERATRHGLLPVRMTPSSFSLIPMTAFSQVGRFDDDFFIDHIDVDFCHRCRRAGLVVAMDPEVRFPHVIGNGYVTLFSRGISPVSSPFRHYYQTRNILLSARRRGVRPLDALIEIGKRLIVIGIVGSKAGKFFARYGFAVRGIADGLRNRGGALPQRVK